MIVLPSEALYLPKFTYLWTLGVGRFPDALLKRREPGQRAARDRARVSDVGGEDGARRARPGDRPVACGGRPRQPRARGRGLCKDARSRRLRAESRAGRRPRGPVRERTFPIYYVAMIVLAGADVVLAEGIRSPATLIIEGDRITDVVPGQRARVTGSTLRSAGVHHRARVRRRARARCRRHGCTRCRRFLRRSRRSPPASPNTV